MFKISPRLVRNALMCSILPLAACASFTDTAVQEIHIETPGAYNTKCHMYVGGLRYTVNPPESIGIYKSKEDLVVDCMAPGNRRKEVYIEATLTDNSAWNMGTGGLGYAYDYATSAMFEYPSVIVVDFTNSLPRDERMPAQNLPDVRQPETYRLEEYAPSQPKLNSDADRIENKLLRRGEIPEGYSASAISSDGSSASAFSDGYSMGKGDLMSASPAPAPANGASPSSSGGPISLIPGE
ncbi:MAG: hypothetical protein CMH26_07910 [Micavibrio sp.]|nr:hypothetical protein [Micavibrio sp.]|tara:strand:+ start:2301 stop:3017 length:717 start_codon:yes stop_codon:yes gene_type:complete